MEGNKENAPANAGAQQGIEGGAPQANPPANTGEPSKAAETTRKPRKRKVVTLVTLHTGDKPGKPEILEPGMHDLDTDLADELLARGQAKLPQEATPASADGDVKVTKAGGDTGAKVTK